MDVIKHRSGQGNGWSNFKNPVFGYSLIELLAVLATVSILMATALPDFNSLIANERTTTITNALAGALAYARSQAIIKNVNIITCQSINSRTCNKSEKWDQGWIIFIDKNRNKQRETEETLLRVYAAFDNGTTVTFDGSGAGIKYYIKYKPSGEAHPNGSFFICNPDIGKGKALIMSHSGRLRLSNKRTNGSVVTCS